MTSHLTVQDLRSKLESLHLSTQGTKPLLRRRLRKALAASSSSSGGGGSEASVSSGSGSGSERQRQQEETRGRRTQRRPRYTHFLVVDVEATCDERVGSGGSEGSAGKGKAGEKSTARGAMTLDGFAYPNEIIELPVVLVRIRAGDDEDGDDEDGDDDVDACPAAAAATATATASPPAPVDVVDTFHTYVRPTLRPTLTPFCRTLTGITQQQVDAAPTFASALDMLCGFLSRHHLLRCEGEAETAGAGAGAGAGAHTHTHAAWTDTHPGMHPRYATKLTAGVCWVSHGPFDLRDFVPKQCWISALPYGPPAWLRGPVLDLKRAVRAYRGGDEGGDEGAHAHAQAAHAAVHPHGSIPFLLEVLHLGAFQGTLHCGLDDTRNLARVLVALVRGVMERDAEGEPPRSRCYGRDQVLLPNVTLAEYPPFPSDDGDGDGDGDAPEYKVKAKAGGRFYPKRWPWMGKKLGVVRWEDGARVR